MQLSVNNEDDSDYHYLYIRVKSGLTRVDENGGTTIIFQNDSWLYIGQSSRPTRGMVPRLRNYLMDTCQSCNQECYLVYAGKSCFTVDCIE